MNSIDPHTENAVRRFANLIASRYDIDRIIVYGSRARGTHRPDSDADVAVILRGEPQPFLATKIDMADIAFDVLLETGILISPIPIWLDEWEHPEEYSNRSVRLTHSCLNRNKSDFLLHRGRFRLALARRARAFPSTGRHGGTHRVFGKIPCRVQISA